MATLNEKIHIIIHSAATAAAAAASGMAQVPGSDNLVITPIQLAMIQAIGKVHDQGLDRSASMCILSTVSAGVAGRVMSQILVGWIPGFGNALNASTAFTITEAIGWAADAVLACDEMAEEF